MAGQFLCFHRAAERGCPCAQLRCAGRRRRAPRAAGTRHCGARIRAAAAQRTLRGPAAASRARQSRAQRKDRRDQGRGGLSWGTVRFDKTSSQSKRFHFFCFAVFFEIQQTPISLFLFRWRKQCAAGALKAADHLPRALLCHSVIRCGAGNAHAILRAAVHKAAVKADVIDGKRLAALRALHQRSTTFARYTAQSCACSGMRIYSFAMPASSPVKASVSLRPFFASAGMPNSSKENQA